MSDNRPIMRIEFYEKATKKKYRVGSVWRGRTEYSDNVAFETTTNLEGKWPTMSIVEAQKRAAAKEGYIQIAKVREPGQRSEARREESGGGGGFDDDIPFMCLKGERI